MTEATEIYKKSAIETYLLPLTICLLGLLAFRFAVIYFAKTDLFFDEAQYWAWSQSMDFGYFSKPPVLAWSIRGMTEVCGNSEFCIRAASPVFHTITGFILFFAGRALYNTKVGLWSALTYVTIPGVSFSAGLISTDVPLLAFWSLALWAFIEFQKSKDWKWAILMGVAIGFGLMSKYAMIYFFLCMAFYLIATPDARWIIKNKKFWLAVAIAAAILSPNIIWNLQNELVTFSHTADNANWKKGSMVHPDRALGFFGAQLGVFGPVLFVVFMMIIWWSYRYKDDPTSTKALIAEDKMLMAFSIPIILIITVQAFLSRAHANWAATAYPAATLLVVAFMLRREAWLTIKTSFIIHLITIVFLALGVVTAGRYALPGGNEPYARVLGWKELAETTRNKLKEHKYAAILTRSRLITAELVYYMRNDQIPIYAWKYGKYPKNYYEMSQPYRGIPGEDSILLVSQRSNPQRILQRFNNVEVLGKEIINSGVSQKRTLYYFKLSGFKG